MHTHTKQIRTKSMEHSRKQSLVQGIKAYPKALKFITKNRLWRYFLIPAIVAFLLLSGVIYLAYEFIPNIVFFLSDWIGYEDWQFRGANWLERIFNFFLGSGLAISTGLLSLLLYKYTMLILLSPFLAWMSEKVEHIQTQTTYDFEWSQFVKDILRGVRMNLRNMSREIPITLFLLLFSLIPVVGIAATALIFLVSAYFVGFGMIDYYHERQRMSVAESATKIRKQRPFAIAIGAVFNLILFIPIIGVMIAPLLSVIATTLTVVEREQKAKGLESGQEMENKKIEMIRE